MTEFRKNARMKDGHRSYCKVCENARKAAYYEANKEKIKAYCAANKKKMKAYREANREKIKANLAAYREANREKIKARMRARRAYEKEMRELQEESGIELSPLHEQEL